jgi:hypothetical protein
MVSANACRYGEVLLPRGRSLPAALLCPCCPSWRGSCELTGAGAADLKSLHGKRRIRLRDFKSKSGHVIMSLPMPVPLRSSQYCAASSCANFGFVRTLEAHDSSMVLVQKFSWRVRSKNEQKLLNHHTRMIWSMPVMLAPQTTIFPVLRSRSFISYTFV